jgi:hypothetical protein
MYRAPTEDGQHVKRPASFSAAFTEGSVRLAVAKRLISYVSKEV